MQCSHIVCHTSLSLSLYVIVVPLLSKVYVICTLSAVLCIPEGNPSYRTTTVGLLMRLCQIYPSYTLVFQSVMALDISAHWLLTHATLYSHFVL